MHSLANDNHAAGGFIIQSRGPRIEKPVKHRLTLEVRAFLLDRVRVVDQQHVTTLAGRACTANAYDLPVAGFVVLELALHVLIVHQLEVTAPTVLPPGRADNAPAFEIVTN